MNQIPSLPSLCVHQLLKIQAENNPDAIAIAAPDRPHLTYLQLWVQVNDIVAQLNAIGIGRNDRVAIALPNGPEMAVAFLASASGGTCAPLNPAYKASEFDFYLSDLNSKVLIVQAGIDSPAIAVAQKRDIPIVQLSPISDAPAGIFTLLGGQLSEPELPGLAAPDDTALVLHTSGTTSRPKIVPLTHKISALQRRIFAKPCN